ncbi:MAG: beta strand repeat-containing protein, partial [Saprospiraceae bacterium]
MKKNILANGRMIACALIGAFALVFGPLSAQTTLLSASGDGGFQNGATFAANGWTVVNGAGIANQWFVGTAPTLFANNSAYVSDDPAGATHNYNNASGSLVHFYRDIILPAGETNLTYGYDWYCQGESTYDFIQISVGPTSIVPVAQSGITGSVTITNPLIPGTTVIGAHNLLGTVQTVSSTISSSQFGNCFAPVTIRLFITWRNDGSAGTQPPAAIDNISLTSVAPAGGPLSGTRTVGPGGNYTTLTSAVNAVNLNGVTAPVVLELLSSYTSAGETFPIVLGGQSSCNPPTSTNTVTIRPAAGATALSIAGNNAGPTIDFNGGRWWRVDGRPGGAGSAKELIISNTNTTGQAIRLINESSNNIVRYCDVRGVNTSTTSGVILFSTTSGVNGNDNNLIEFNDIRDGATTPANCIYSLGSTTSRNTWNSNNTIANNNIYNFFLSSSTSFGMVVTTGSTNWTISGNSFYQTVARTLAAAQFSAINMTNTITENFVITNNFIGGSAPQCGGAAMTLTGAGNFRGVNLTVGPGLTTIQGNTIRNINLTTSNATLFNGGLLLGQGSFLCSGNTIGSLTENNSIALTYSGSSSGFGGIIAGGTSPTNLVTISNNNVGGITLVTSGVPATPPVLRAISVQGTSVGHNYVVTGNTIGSQTLANSISGDGNVAGSVTGIVSFSNAPNQQITNNNIANMVAPNTNTTNVMWGILAQGTTNVGTYNISGNTIRDLQSASSATGTGGAASIMGISIITNLSTFGVNTVAQNTVHSLVNTNATAAASVTGIVNSVPLVTNNTVARNFIHSLNLQSSATTGIVTGIQLNAGASNVQNNMVRLGVDAAGADITNGYGFFGIREAVGNNNVQFNSVYIGGAGVSAGSTATFAFTSAVTTGTRNYISNIFHNARSNGAGTGKHYAITMGGTTPNPAGIASNYNDLFVSGTGGFVGLYNAVDQTALADWRTATGNDFQSVSANPQFVAPNGTANTVDLHIQAGVATVVEAGGQPVVAVTTDYDGQTRSSLTPTDIGADAGNFTLSDASGPGIAYTILGGACGTGNIALNNVNITDGTGIPLAGALVPRVYYRKGAGAWFSNAGTLASGNANNSTWSFNILAADMGGLAAGDVVSYYVIAQDNAARIGSNAGGAVATDVNNVTTQPVTPNTVTVQGALMGTYTVGVGGNYATLTAAVADYNTKCIAGPVVFSLTDATYPAETFPIAINQIFGASAVNTLTIRPAAGNAATISGASTTSIIRFNGADWVILDGSNAGGTDRSLTLNNTSTAASTAVVWVSSLGATTGSENNIIRNCNIVAGSNTVTSTFGIFVGGTTISTTGTGDNNDNLEIQNNAITTAYYGIYARSSSILTANDGLQIIGNAIGSAVAANYVLFRGMDIHYANAPVIRSNTVFNMITSTLGTSIAGIDLGTGVVNAQVIRNNLTGIQNTNTGGWGSYGIFISGTAGTIGTLMANNFISDMLGSNYFSGTTFHAYGIRLSGGFNTRVYNNSINFFGPVTGGTSASNSANLIITSTLAQGTEIRNNIFRNTQEFAISGSNTYNVYAIAGVEFVAINNNVYYGVGNANTTYNVGFDGVARTSLAAWQNATGQDGSSFGVQPNFVSNTDLHLTANTNQCIDGGGAPLAQVTIDIDGQARNATTPDIGADEFANPDLNLSVSENSGLNNANDGVVCSGATVTLTGAGGSTYNWSTGFNGNPLVVNPVSTTTYTVTISQSNGCTDVLSTIITVNPLPTAFAVTGGGSYCAPGVGVPVGLSGSVNGVSYQLRLNGVNTGSPVAGTGSAIAFGNQTLSGNYTVVATSASTNCSANMTGTAVVTAFSSPLAFNVTGGGTYCSPGLGVPVGLSGSQAAVTYQLLRGGVNVGAPVAGTGSPLAFGNQTVAGVYTVVATSNVGACTATMTGAVTVTVNASPSLSASTVQPTTCVAANGSINLTVTGGVGPFTYNWQTSNGSGLVQGQEDQSGLTVGTYTVVVTGSNNCTATLAVTLSGPGGCEVCPVVGALNASPSGVCVNTTVSLTASGLSDMGNTYGITFKFFGAPTSTPYVGGTVIATIPNSSLGNNGTTAQTSTSFASGATYYIYAVLDQLPIDQSCRPSALVVLPVVNIPSVNPVSNQVVCNNAATAAVNFSGPVPGTIYKWTNNTPGIGLAASGTGNIASFTAINSGSAPVVATITVTPETLPSVGAVCTGAPITFTITVNPTPAVNAVANQVVCNNSATAAVNFTGPVAGTTYAWTNNTPSIGLAAAGNGNIASFTAVNTGTTPVTATITVTPTANGCTGAPITFTITVNPTPNVAAVTNQVLCSGSTTAAVTFTGNVPGTVFNWTNNAPSIGLAASGSGNIASFTATNTGNAPVVATITVTPVFANGGTNCSGTPVTFTITVNPIPSINALANVAYCNNTTGGPIALNGPVAGATYTWTNSNTAIGLGASGTGNIPAFTATNAGTAPISGTITVTVSYSNGGVTCPGVQTSSFIITVNPTPTVNQPVNQVVCSGNATNAVTLTSIVPGTTFNWTNNTPAIGLPGSGTGNIPSFVAVNNGVSPVTATITITPVYTNGGITCSGTPRAFTIIVNPTPTAGALANQAVCSGQNTSGVNFAGVIGAVYTWTNNTPSIGLPGSGTGNIPSFKAVNNTVNPVVATIVVTATYTNAGVTCSGPVSTFTITVNPTPIVDAGADKAICPGQSVTLSATGGVTCSWSPITYLTGANTCNPVASPPVTTLYTVTVTNASGCTNTDQVWVQVHVDQALVCNDNVQVSLDPDGQAVVLPDMVLEGTYDNDAFYSVQIFNNQNQPQPNPVTCANVGQTLKVRVRDNCNGNYCWGTIKVEDKLAPELTCNNVTVNCAVTNYTPAYLANVLGIGAANPTAIDNCVNVDLNYSDELFDLDCTTSVNGISGLSAYVRRSWTAVDGSGNQASCTQFIYFRRIDVADIQLPADVTVSCSNPNTGPSFTGAPFIQAFGQTFLLSPNNTFCELNAVYTDQLLPVCDGTYKILRTWTLYDWCKPTVYGVNPKNHIQLIKVNDDQGPVVTCPTNITVTTDPFSCERDLDLPDFIVSDNCSRLASVKAQYAVNNIGFTVDGNFSSFPGNNFWIPDTLGVLGFAQNLPLGTTLISYVISDDCGNTNTCAFNVTVEDGVPPTAACDEFTQVSLGIDGMILVNASTFDDGSYDNCSPVTFKARRMDNNDCQSNGFFYDQVKFCCEDIGDTLTVVFRVYDVPVAAGDVALDFEELNANDCMVQVFVDDKIKPSCLAPANVTVSCENFDPSLWAYGQPVVTDNCCVDTVTSTANLNAFDTLCNKGTIIRRFTAVDCAGQQTQCSQRVIVNYEQDYYVRFPNDVIVTFCDSSGVYGEPTLFGEDCELLGMSFEDQVFTVVPDACFKIERTWKIINWCTYDANAPCINVPNPEPNATANSSANLPGPIVSPLGTPNPWAPTVVKIKASDPVATNYSTFWNANANCYVYKQIIKIIDTQ